MEKVKPSTRDIGGALADHMLYGDLKNNESDFHNHDVYFYAALKIISHRLFMVGHGALVSLTKPWNEELASDFRIMVTRDVDTFLDEWFEKKKFGEPIPGYVNHG